MSYTKLANSILTSTIWMEDDQTRIVWFAMLAMADKNGEVQASIPGLANVARVPIESCRAAITKFLSPDPDSRTKDDEGRRIEDIKGGWFLINHSEYRELASDEDRKRKAADRQQRARDKEKRNVVTDRHKSSHQIPQAEAEAEAELRKKEKEGSRHLHSDEFRTVWGTWLSKLNANNGRPLDEFAEDAQLYRLEYFETADAIDVVRFCVSLTNCNNLLTDGEHKRGPSRARSNGKPGKKGIMEYVNEQD